MQLPGSQVGVALLMSLSLAFAFEFVPGILDSNPSRSRYGERSTFYYYYYGASNL